MSAILYLVRHAVAEEAGVGAPDAARRLTGEGRRKMQQIAAALGGASGVRPEAVLSSPLTRARETAEIVAEAVAGSVGVEVLTFLAPGHRPEEVLRALHVYRRVGELMLVGHQPGLGEIGSYLLTGSPGLVPLPFKTGGVAAIAVGSLPPRTAGELLWFLTPEQLRAMRP